MLGRIRLFILLALAPWPAVSVQAADNPTLFDWRGFYIGLHAGGGLDLVDVADPRGPSIFGDTVRSSGFLGGGQLGYNWQSGAAVFGVEADVSWARMDGTNTCFAYSGIFVSANCAADVNALGTVTGRLGWTLPFDSRTLVYAKAGGVWLRGDVDATTSGGAGYPSTGSGGTRWGWTVGGGVERAFSERWSIKAEYGFLWFGNRGFATPISDFQPVPSPDPNAMIPVASTATHVSQGMHLFKLGLNYRFGGAAPNAGLPPPSTPQPVSDVTVEFGARYVHGWGRFQKDLGIMGQGVASPASRLTYQSPGSGGMEGFARLDSSSGLMLKGMFGGATGGGRLNDEDWGLPFAVFVPYSNTISSVETRIRYWSADVGYDWWRDASVRVTPFVGYTQFREIMQGYGCAQIANRASDCSSPLPTSVLAIIESDTWRALRLGVAFDIELAPRLSLAAEAAYLPHVKFSGTDDHVLRSLLSPEDGKGVGVQLELMLSYALTDALRVGVGGRYWSMWTTTGNVNFGGTGEIVPMRYAVEQAQILVQGSYKFDVTR